MTESEVQMIAELRAELARRVGAERFDLWFGPTVTLKPGDGKLIVLAPDQFKLDRLVKLREHLQAASRHVLGSATTVEFAISSPETSGSSVEADTPAPPPSRHPQPASAIAPTRQGRSEQGAVSVLSFRSSPRRESASSPMASQAASQPAYRRKFAHLGSFVLGDSNRLAYTAATRIAEKLGAANPVYFFGPTGSGKTHLLEGIWSAARRTGAAKRVVFLSAEQFTSFFLEALPGRKGLPSFRAKYRGVDLLIIDDIQFFLGKKATLVELFHTVEALLREGRQLVLSGDRSLAELGGLGAELIARLSGGLVCGIESPDVEVRQGILRQFAGRLGMNIHEDVLSLLASSLPGDARQLAGAMHRLEAASQATKQPISAALAQSALSDLLGASRRSMRLSDIEAAVCDVCGVSSSDLQSGRKSKQVSHPRMLAMWLARKYTRAAYSEIGEYFGRRSHATVISANAKVEGWMAARAAMHLPHGDCPTEEVVRRIESQLRAG